MLWMDRYADVGTQPVAKASNMMEASNLDNPVPSLQYIAEKPSSAAYLIASTGK